MNSKTLSMLAAAALVFTCIPAMAQPSLSRPEFSVSSGEGAKRLAPVAEFHRNGDSVVVWEDQQRGLTARTFTASGTPRDTERILVANDPITVPFSGYAVTRKEPAVVTSPGGTFHLFWKEEKSYVRVVPFLENRTLLGAHIYGQRFDRNGDALGEPFRVSGSDLGEESRPRAVRLSREKILVTWQTADRGVFARAFDLDGNPLAPALRADDAASGPGLRPVAARDRHGRIIIAWEGCCDADGDEAIFVRRLDDGGNPLADPQQINVTTVGKQQAPAIGAGVDGTFLVAWQSPTDASGEQYRIYGRSIHVASGQLGTEETLSDGPGWGHASPAVTVNRAGAFLVSWMVWQGDFRTGLRGVQVNHQGLALTADFDISERAIGAQTKIHVAASRFGSFLATWLGRDPGGRIGVEARLLGSQQLEDFCDDAALFNTRGDLADNPCP